MANYEVNDLVQSHEFGIGTVTGFSKFEDGRDVVIVNFERIGKKKLAIEYARLQKITQEYLDELKANHDGWPESTFVNQPADQSHYLASHWQPFMDNENIEQTLKVHAPIAKELLGYGSFFQSPLGVLDTAMKPLLLSSPDQYMGLSIIFAPVLEALETHNAYPFCSKGSQVSLTLQRVHVWDGGYGAQIEAGWNDADICFFDTRFIHNRDWYVAEELYDFIVTGIAYDAKPAERHIFKIPHSPEMVKQLIEAGVFESEDDFSDEFDTSQAAVFLPIPEWDKDDYQFQGKIKELVTFDDFLGQTGWIATVTVMKTLADDLDQDLKVVITKRAWQGEQPPEIEKYIEGKLWLQGYLWNVTNRQHF